MRAIEKIRKIRKELSGHRPLINILISKGNVIHNLNQFKRKYPQFTFSPVLKSNAYGHGLKEIAEILKKEEKPFLAVDSVFEAQKLNNLGVSDNILVIGYTPPEEISKNRIKRVSFSIVSLPQLKILGEKCDKKTKIHLKVDTGMGRQGIAETELGEAVRIIKSNKNLVLEGVSSHFADADGGSSKLTLRQIEKWNNIVGKMKKEFDSIEYFHISATSGLRYADKINANMVRLGIGLYGFNPGSNPELELKPALSARTIITSVRELTPGDSVGYNAAFKADKKMKVATIPFGYFEGFDRRLSNKGFVKVNNLFCPVIGKVSMNITSFDVTDIPDVAVGDEVIVISDDSGDKNSVSNMANMCNTISYVILVHIPEHLKRVIVDV